MLHVLLDFSPVIAAAVHIYDTNCFKVIQDRKSLSERTEQNTCRIPIMQRQRAE